MQHAVNKKGNQLWVGVLQGPFSKDENTPSMPCDLIVGITTITPIESWPTLLGQ